METVKYLCEFFFCNFWHFLELAILGLIVFPLKRIVINRNKLEDNSDDGQ